MVERDLRSVGFFPGVAPPGGYEEHKRSFLTLTKFRFISVRGRVEDGDVVSEEVAFAMAEYEELMNGRASAAIDGSRSREG